jgi:hypothetical protein
LPVGLKYDVTHDAKPGEGNKGRYFPWPGTGDSVIACHRPSRREGGLSLPQSHSTKHAENRPRNFSSALLDRRQHPIPRRPLAPRRTTSELDASLNPAQCPSGPGAAGSGSRVRSASVSSRGWSSFWPSACVILGDDSYHVSPRGQAPASRGFRRPKRSLDRPPKKSPIAPLPRVRYSSHNALYASHCDIPPRRKRGGDLLQLRTTACYTILSKIYWVAHRFSGSPGWTRRSASTYVFSHSLASRSR